MLKDNPIRDLFEDLEQAIVHGDYTMVIITYAENNKIYINIEDIGALSYTNANNIIVDYDNGVTLIPINQLKSVEVV